MNSNLFQTILTIITLAVSSVSGVLLSMGCSQIGDTISCMSSTAPTWLVPYLAIIASATGIMKLVLAAFQGKLAKPTVVVSETGKPGTVTADQVNR